MAKNQKSKKSAKAKSDSHQTNHIRENGEWVWQTPAVFGVFGTVFTIVSAVSGHWLDWWVKYLLIPASLALVILALCEYLIVKGFSKKYSFILSIVLFSAFLLTAIIAYPNAPLFSVSYTWSSNTTQKRQWYVREGKAIPIYCCALFNFTNQQGTPLLIDSYIVEEKNKHGEWERISLDSTFSILNEGGIVYAGEDPKDVSEFNYTTFESAAANKNISPGETIRGWVFLKEAVLGPLRFTIKDSVGNTLSESVKIGSNPNPMQPIMINFGRKHIDISEFIQSP